MSSPEVSRCESTPPKQLPQFRGSISLHYSINWFPRSSAVILTMKFSFASSLALLVAVNEAKNVQRNIQARSSYNPKRARQLPADPVGVKTITTPQNVTIRYKEPGKEGVCETTPGVNSYSGYIDLDVRAS